VAYANWSSVNSCLSAAVLHPEIMAYLLKVLSASLAFTAVNNAYKAEGISCCAFGVNRTPQIAASWTMSSASATTAGLLPHCSLLLLLLLLLYSQTYLLYGAVGFTFGMGLYAMKRVLFNNDAGS